MLVQVSADTPQKVEAFRKAMEPLRQTLKQFKFLGGNQLNYSDIAIAGIFLVSPKPTSIPQTSLTAKYGHPACHMLDALIVQQHGVPEMLVADNKCSRATNAIVCL